MIYIPSYIKINLSIRVFVPRYDGDHDFSKLFHMLGPIEWLSIRWLNGTNRDDIINSYNIGISGTNIISRAIEF